MNRSDTITQKIKYRALEGYICKKLRLFMVVRSKKCSRGCRCKTVETTKIPIKTKVRAIRFFATENCIQTRPIIMQSLWAQTAQTQANRHHITPHRLSGANCSHDGMRVYCLHTHKKPKPRASQPTPKGYNQKKKGEPKSSPAHSKNVELQI
jgi:hypothetical protein